MRCSVKPIPVVVDQSITGSLVGSLKLVGPHADVDAPKPDMVCIGMLKSTTTSPVLDAPPPQLPLLATPLDPGPCELLLDPELAEPPVELELAELLVPEPEGAADPPVELDDEPDAAVELERVAAAPEVELDVEPEAVAADEERLVVPVVGPLAPVVVLEEDPQAMRVTTAAGSVIFR